MLSRHSQRGEGKLGCIIGLILLVGAVYVAYKLVPVKLKAADMRQTITDEARSAGSSQDKAIRKRILERANELGLPLASEDLKITRGNQQITIEADYTVPVAFPGGYVYQWHFHHEADNPIF
ncbi:MAG: hypothetical protein WBX15_02600 [Thermoanaerobaculia bacterium]